MMTMTILLLHSFVCISSKCFERPCYLSISVSWLAIQATSATHVLSILDCGLPRNNTEDVWQRTNARARARNSKSSAQRERARKHVWKLIGSSTWLLYCALVTRPSASACLQR